MNPRSEPLSALSMAILLALAEGPRHGYALMEEVEVQSDGVLKPGTGSLYAALQRLMDQTWIVETKPQPGDDRRRRSYAITKAGRQVVRDEATRMIGVLREAARQKLAPPLSAIRDAK